MDTTQKDKGKIQKECYLSFSGSFNPIHTAHIDVLYTVYCHLEKSGYIVKAAYIAPSSDDYVQDKLGLELAIPLKHRIMLCEIAIKSWNKKYTDNSRNWLQVCPFGIMSSSKTVNLIRKTEKIPNTIPIYEIGGADYALRCKPWITNKPFICIGRKKYTDQVRAAINLAKKDGDSIKAGGFMFVDVELDDISSTLIREIIQREGMLAGTRSEILEKGLLEEDVYKYIMEHQLF